MKAIMMMFDSLNKHMLPPYGGDWIKAPNFERLAKKTVKFNKFYAGSLPCIPARREIHTGRVNFLHRDWGPIEPFDDSMPEILRENNVYTHLISDHFHYWEDGGATFPNRYNTWEIIRGQAGDPWIGSVATPKIPEQLNRRSPDDMIGMRNDYANRRFIEAEGIRPQEKTMDRGLEFIRKNHESDNWFLHIETFDPHEPFWAEPAFEAMYPDDYKGPHFDWPDYAPVCEDEAAIQHVRNEYAALVSQCDYHLGRLLDMMDELNLWEDTMLIINVDHGFLLSEHGWWGKKTMPFYEEVVNTPFFLWEPSVGMADVTNNALCQTIDIAPTLLDYFGVEIPKDMEGIPLTIVLEDESAGKEAILFGQHGMHVNCSDGRYVYMRAPKDEKNAPLNNYTLMPMHMKSRFSVEELKGYELSGPFEFTKNIQLMKTAVTCVLPDKPFLQVAPYETMLFDLETDPSQSTPIENTEVEERMIRLMLQLMEKNDAPSEQYERLGLEMYL